MAKQLKFEDADLNGWWHGLRPSDKYVALMQLRGAELITEAELRDLLRFEVVDD